MFLPVLRSVLLLSGRDRLKFFLLLATRISINLLDVLGLLATAWLGRELADSLSGESQKSSVSRESLFLGLSSFEITLVIIGLFLLKSLAGAVALRLSTKLLARVEGEFASQIARYLFTRDFHEVRAYDRGDIQWSVASSTSIAISGLLFSGSALVSEFALFLAVVMVFFYVSPGTALAGFLYFLAVFFVFQLLINSRLRRLGQRLASEFVSIHNILFDAANVFRESYVMGRLEHFLRKFEASRKQYSSDQGLQRFVMALPRYFVEASLMVGLLLLIVWQAFNSELSSGLSTLGVFLVGGLRITAAMLPLQNAITDIRINGPQAEKAQALLQKANHEFREDSGRPSVVENELAMVEKSAGGASVVAEDLNYAFPNGKTILLNQISFSVFSGGFLAVIGPSGAGKTTLMDVILGLRQPTSGTITIDGLAPRDFLKKDQGGLAFVPQDPRTVEGSIAENVALGVEKSEIDFNGVQRVLDLVGLSSWVSSRPGGIHSKIAIGGDLSGGQLQRLAIARALYHEPALLVLDEATSALDADTEAGISDLLKRLSGTVTVIVVAHRLSTVQRADSIVFLENGRVLGLGSLGELRQQLPQVRRYIELLNIDAS